MKKQIQRYYKNIHGEVRPMPKARSWIRQLFCGHWRVGAGTICRSDGPVPGKKQSWVMVCLDCGKILSKAEDTIVRKD